eukprot:scaffold129907_cov13-Tisochrysis_lutea.AAC.1
MSGSIGQLIPSGKTSTGSLRSHLPLAHRTGRQTVGTITSSLSQYQSLNQQLPGLVMPSQRKSHSKNLSKVTPCLMK